MGFQKKLPKLIAYRDYKKFPDAVNNFAFGLSNFKKTISNIFDKHAPIKQKYLRDNEAPFMTKELHREIMKRSICKKLLRTAKNVYFSILRHKKSS